MSALSRKDFARAVRGMNTSEKIASCTREQFREWLLDDCDQTYRNDGSGLTFWLRLKDADSGRDDYCRTEILPRIFSALPLDARTNFVTALQDTIEEWSKDPRADQNMPNRNWTLKYTLDAAMRTIKQREATDAFPQPKNAAGPA